MFNNNDYNNKQARLLWQSKSSVVTIAMTSEKLPIKIGMKKLRRADLVGINKDKRTFHLMDFAVLINQQVKK